MAVALSKDLDKEEWNYFLRGSEKTDRKNQPPNPHPDWIPHSSWDAICDVDKMPAFTQIIGAFTHNAKEWKRWYGNPTPEDENLPGEWEAKCN